MAEYEDSKMTLIGHVGELRKRMMIILAVVVVTMIIGLFLAPKILLFLKHQPSVAEVTWNVFSPWDGARIYMNVALIFSIITALPVILYQLWAFVREGLEMEEQAAAFKYIPYAFLCFLIGLAFSYFIVFPMSLAFTTSIAAKLDFVQTYGVVQYFGFMFNIILPVSLAFELPIIVIFLTKIGLLNPRRLQLLRRHAYLVLVIVASLISPPELLSHLMVFVPLVGLYEISLILARIVYRKQQAEVLTNAA
ncbi:twin-arginine translocase subunit TatC [Paenibacillus cremeus]|uniref:Sec-independent protein translocase protein TatC n=1 Tax=Paenibacillus cremeus TaxID=2163881 RepID=A0A559KF53_9BACL|nr:twin-arginine translocase subunit TatC [Paenibacillus cremeus]TVY10759.1 twin-arginine translocase subunit TatC [Paenibacillus cremeus]